MKEYSEMEKRRTRAAENLNSLLARGWTIYVPLAHELRPEGTRSQLSSWFEEDVRIRGSDKWQVRRIMKDEDWRKLQASKIESGNFKPVPWSTHPKWIEWSSKSPQCDHFVHCSTKDDNAIAYTKNEEAGRMDIRTRISPSKYFEKFAGAEYRDLYVKEWLALWTKHINSIELKFATTREEIRHVYETGPDSCMSGPASKFFRKEKSPHPVEAYAGGDLAIAYTEKKNGKISSRAVVWPEKKIIGRRYGNDANILFDLLKAQGYGNGLFENARLLMIDAQPYTKKPCTFLCPYIDAPTQYVSYEEKDKTLKLHDKRKDGRVAGNTQAGYLAFPLPFLSDFSGKSFYPSNDPPARVFVGQRKFETWALSESHEHAYICYISKRLYSKKNCPPTLMMAGGHSIVSVSPYVERKIVKCGFFDSPVFFGETKLVVVGYEPDGSLIKERWSYQAIRNYTFVYGEQHYAIWTRTNFPWALGTVPANEEHKYATSKASKIQPATYPCRVTRENVHRYLRRVVFDPSGEPKWAIISWDSTEKIEIALAALAEE